MRILLIWPRIEDALLSDELSCCEPLSLEYIAGGLHERHDVAIHDLRLDGPLSSLADAEPPDLVGLAIPFTTAVGPAHRIARQVKRMWPSTLLVIGGHHPSVSSQWLSGMPADYAITGEGTAAFSALAESIDRGLNPADVPGVVPFGSFLSGHTLSPTRDIHELPLPHRESVRHNRDKYFHSIYRPISLVRFSVGCPHNCSFCVLWRMTERRYLTKEIPRIIEELRAIEVGNVYVVDDEAFIDPQRMLQLAKAVEDAGLRKKFHMYLRTDTALRSPEVLEKWAEVGLDSVLIGAESTVDGDLAEYAKGTTAAQTAAAMKVFRGLGVKVRANFIVRPDFERDDFLGLARSVRTLGVDLPSFSVLTPLPGTQLFDARRRNIVCDNPDLYDCYHSPLPTTLPLETFYSHMADLLQDVAAGGNAAGSRGASPNAFYYSTSNAFRRMINSLRDGHRLHRMSWDESLQTSGQGISP